MDTTTTRVVASDTSSVSNAVRAHAGKLMKPHACSVLIVLMCELEQR
jgi:hypothetical protein